METRRKNVGDEILEVSPVKGYRSWIWIMNYELPCLGMHIWIIYIGGSALPLIFWSILLGSLPHIIGWLKPPKKLKKKGTMKQNQRRKLWIKMSTIESNSKFFIWNQFGCSWIIEKLQLSTLPKIKNKDDLSHYRNHDDELSEPRKLVMTYRSWWKTICCFPVNWSSSQVEFSPCCEWVSKYMYYINQRVLKKAHSFHSKERVQIESQEKEGVLTL